MGTQLALYRNEIARLFGEIDGRDTATLELRGEIARLKAECAEKVARAGACAPEDGICAHAAEAMRLQDEVARLQKELAGRAGRMRRYENSTTPGMHGYNEERSKVRAAEERMLAAEEGREVEENRTIGPPPGHDGQKCEIKPVRIIEHEYEKCPRCGNAHIKRRSVYSKVIADFDGDKRILIVVLHTGHAVRHMPQDLQAKFSRHQGHLLWHHGTGLHPGVRVQKEQRRGHCIPYGQSIPAHVLAQHHMERAQGDRARPGTHHTGNSGGAEEGPLHHT